MRLLFISDTAEEEAARRARIQARLEQERNEKATKQKNKAGSSTSNEARSSLRSQPTAQPAQQSGEKVRVAHQRRYGEDRAKKLEQKQKPTEKNHKKRENKGKIRETPHTDRKPKPKSADRKHKKPEIKQKEGPKQEVDDKNLVKQPDQKELKKPVKKIRKPAAPALSFEELMNVAKQQAENPDAARELLAKRQPAKEPKNGDVKEKTATRDADAVKIEKSIKNKKSLPVGKQLATPSKAAKKFPEKRKTDGISKKTSLSNARAAQQLLEKRSPEAGRNTRTPEKPKQMMIERETISEKRRELMTKRYVQEMQRKRRYHDDDDDEMDEFIDDSEAGPDISSYIKDIFGYDKSK